MWRVAVSSKKVNFEQKNNDILRCRKRWLVRVFSKCAPWSKLRAQFSDKVPLFRGAEADDHGNRRLDAEASRAVT